MAEERLRELLGHLFTGGTVQRDQVAAGIVATLSTREWADLAQASGVGYSAICAIRRQSQRVAADGLVRLIAASGWTTMTFLGKPLVQPRTHRLPKRSGSTTVRSRAFMARRDGIEVRLRTVLAGPRVPSAKRFARDNGTTLDTLTRHFPALTRSLSQKFNAQERGRRSAREAREIDALREAVFEARRTGDGSRRTVEKLIGRPALFRQPHIRRAYAEAIEEQLPEVARVA